MKHLYSKIDEQGLDSHTFKGLMLNGQTITSTKKKLLFLNNHQNDLASSLKLVLTSLACFCFQFGDYPAACPVAALLQATSIFVSTLSITAIALDRRQVNQETFGSIWEHPWLYRKDTEPSYNSFMYSLVSLLYGIYPLPAMHSLLVKYMLLSLRSSN